MESLSHEQCVPCRGGEPSLGKEKVQELLVHLPEWEVRERRDIPRLRRKFRFPDFTAALEFTWRVGEAADAAGHHPRLITEWGAVTVEWWTHAIRGLHRNDFIMASRTDELYSAG
ncbi:MAG: 4a-hydroxytetrahydrobiopterin dehydratase [Spirochaetia bacterium]